MPSRVISVCKSAVLMLIFPEMIGVDAGVDDSVPGVPEGEVAWLGVEGFALNAVAF